MAAGVSAKALPRAYIGSGRVAPDRLFEAREAPPTARNPLNETGSERCAWGESNPRPAA
jgi:hypothetical protein